MTLLDLSLVTRSLGNLLEHAIEDSPAWGGASPTITPLPPDQGKGTNTLGLYLYHIAEDPQYKNRPAPENPSLPIQYTPMGLHLFYQLTAYHDAENANSVHQAQRLMGLAVKTFHDYPVIDDSSQVLDSSGSPILDGGGNPVSILDSALAGSGNRFRIVLQPLPHNEAVSFWTAGSSPLRLSAYYQVSVALLQPQKISERIGRVTNYSVLALIGHAPRLTGTLNHVAFEIPPNNEIHELELRPAQASPSADDSAPVPQESIVSFLGSGLQGDSHTLLLRRAESRDEIEIEDLNWAVSVEENRVTAIIRETATMRGSTHDAIIVPGIYAARIRVTRRQILPDGSTREHQQLSNVTPFAIIPRIDRVEVNGNRLKVTGSRFRDSDALPPENVEVFVGEKKLAPVTVVLANLGAGQFKITGDNVLHARPPADPTGTLPLRIFVNGAESLPLWIDV